VPRPRALVLILAGGAGGRLELLTRERAKPAVPFAGTHRLIDFGLSNCANSGLEDVWVSQQFNPVSLSDHLANGRPWDLDRTRGGLLLLSPRLGHDDRTGFLQGTADALWRHAPLVREFGPDALVVLSADAVYRQDYGALVEEHLEAGADVTMVTTRVDPDDADRYGVVGVEDGRVVRYAYKPDEPEGDLVTNEVFVFRPDPLLDLLEELGEDAGEDGLQDLGHELLPRLVDAGGAREHRFDAYWRDVGTVPAYWEAHQDMLGDDPPLDLDDPEWPFLTQATSHRAPARVGASAAVTQSLLSPGARVGGTVERSVVGRGACVEPGAVVRDSVLLPGAIVRAGATVERAVVDSGVRVLDGARVGGAGGEIALVGLEAEVGADDDVGPGARFPEVDDDDG
jgi:glucose-1-phosphate adenylyltransferase